MPLCVKVTLQDLSSAVGRFWWHHLTDPYAERRQHLEDFQQILSTCIIENNFGWEMDWKFIDWLTNQKLPSWWPRSFEWRNQRIKLWTIRRPSLSALEDTYRTFKQFFFKIKRNIWKIYYCNKAVICLELFHNSGLFLALRMNVRAAGTNLPDAVQKTDINWSCSSPISLVLMILQSFSRTLRTRRKSKFFLCSTEV